ncbi:hypothetical protein ACJ72_06390, partial [Emergomyces africanus]
HYAAFKLPALNSDVWGWLAQQHQRERKAIRAISRISSQSQANDELAGNTKR